MTVSIRFGSAVQFYISMNFNAIEFKSLYSFLADFEVGSTL